MAIVWIGKDIECDAADVGSLPTNVPTHTKAFINNTDDVMRFNGTTWVLYIANDKTETFTNKTISGASNTLSAIPPNSLSGFSISSPTTDQMLQFDGTNWVNATTALSPPTNIGPERWYIYRVGTTATGPYKAFNKRTGVVEYSGSKLDDVLDPVLVDVEAGDSASVSTFVSSGGYIYVDGTDAYYRLNTSFDGFTLPPYTTIEGASNARILVENGYTNYVFRIPSWHEINPTKYTGSTNAITIKGFNLDENGSPARDWTGILIEGWAEDLTGNPGGVAGCRIEGTKISDCKTGVYLNQTAIRGWITTCWFEKVYVSAAKWAGFDQELMSGYLNEFANNVFRDCAVQSNPGAPGLPAYGFRNMGHKRCIYDNCCVWDVISGQVKGNFDSRISEDNLIIGGILADSTTPPAGTFAAGHNLVLAGYYTAGAAYPAKYVDGLDNTAIVGDYLVGNQLGKIYVPTNNSAGQNNTLSVEGRSTASSLVAELVSGTDSLSSVLSLYNQSRSERLSITKSSTNILFESIKQTAGGTLRAMIFRMNDVPGGTAPESFRILSSADIQMGDGRNFVLNATTGTKIGTTTTGKLGFYNKTPIVQPTAITAPTGGSTIDAEARTAINALRTALTNLGLTA